MDTLLQRLSELSPGRLLGFSWLLLALLFLLTLAPIVGHIANAIGLVVFVGYPYAIALGLPAHMVRPTVRLRAKLLFRALLLVAAAAVMCFSIFPDGLSYPENPMGPVTALLLFAFVVAFMVVVFAPFFLATAALNDVRQSQRGGPSEGSISNFYALYFWLFGGAFRIHPQVQVVLHAA